MPCTRGRTASYFGTSCEHSHSGHCRATKLTSPADSVSTITDALRTPARHVGAARSLCGILRAALVILLCLVSVSNQAIAATIYANSLYDYAVRIPNQYRVEYDQPPSPDHGFRSCWAVSGG
jgi:hypothetical protein